MYKFLVSSVCLSINIFVVMQYFCPTYWKTNIFMELFLNVSYWNISIFYLPEVCFDRVKFLEVPGCLFSVLIDIIWML